MSKFAENVTKTGFDMLLRTATLTVKITKHMHVLTIFCSNTKLAKSTTSLQTHNLVIMHPGKCVVSPLATSTSLQK